MWGILNQMDYAAMDCSPVAEVEEWMNLAKKTLDEASGNGNNPTRTALETVVVRYAYLATKVKSLKFIAPVLHLNSNRDQASPLQS
jgi:hypothetical protein